MHEMRQQNMSFMKYVPRSENDCRNLNNHGVHYARGPDFVSIGDVDVLFFLFALFILAHQKQKAFLYRACLLRRFQHLFLEPNIPSLECASHRDLFHSREQYSED